MLEDSALYVSHVLTRLASILLMSLPSPNCLAYLQELDLLPERIAITSQSVFEKLAHLLHVRAAERVYLLKKNCAQHYFSFQTIDKFFCFAARFVADEKQPEIILIDEQSPSSSFALIISELLVLVCVTN